MLYSELQCSDAIHKAVERMGFAEMTEIQEKTIPVMMAGYDVIAKAPTGTGKTCAFGIPVAEHILPENKYPQAVIMAPTRELAQQIAQELEELTYFMPEVQVACVYGGANMEKQAKRLAEGCQIVVATPGRLMDHYKHHSIDISHVTQIVLDEADEMLNMGFYKDVRHIIEMMKARKSLSMFSATISREVMDIGWLYQHNAEEITVQPKEESQPKIIQYMLETSGRNKLSDLAQIIIGENYKRVMVFCDTKFNTATLANQLARLGFSVDCLHGDLSQKERNQIMQNFRDGKLAILVATDVAARGLDVTDLTHVINYGLPDDIETYTHRSGRTGRAGKSGVSVAIVHSREKGKMRAIEKIIGKKFERGMVPTGEQICEKQLFNLADRIEKVKVNEEEIAKYLPNISRKLGWLTEQDLIKRIVSLEFNRLIDYYRDTPDLDIPDENTRKPKEGNFAKEGRNGRKKDIRTAEAGFERIYINLGKAHGFFPPNLIEMVNSLVPGRVNIGRIDLLSSYSLFDVEKSSAQKVVGALKGNEFYGHRIYAELATDKDYSAPKGKRKGKEEGGRRTNEKRYGNSRRDHSESRSRRDRSSSKTKRSSYSSKKRKG